jgi:hypothetical protein
MMIKKNTMNMTIKRNTWPWQLEGTLDYNDQEEHKDHGDKGEHNT